MGRAGTAYVNDVTNALVVVREELGLAGNVMPANLCRIYDSKLTNSVEYSLPLSNGAGTNWQWNYYGRLVYSSEMFRYYNSCRWLLWCLTRVGGFNQCASPNNSIQIWRYTNV